MSLTDNQTMIQTSSGEFCLAQYQSVEGAEPLVLICGLGMQLIRWRDSFISALAEQGYRVIMPDNRDAGLSMKVTEGYTISDMANDYVEILDALGIEAAHIVGTSLGGMIAQRLLINHPEKVKSIVSIMSTTSDTALPSIQPEVSEALVQEPKSHERVNVVENNVSTSKFWSSPDYPTNDEELARAAGLAFDRSYYPEGVVRQYTAAIADFDIRAKDLQAMSNKTPCFVIHGEDDRLIPCSHGRATAQVLDCSYLEVSGMGHDMPEKLSLFMANAITGFISSTR